jgi:hypothetical protein
MLRDKTLDMLWCTGSMGAVDCGRHPGTASDTGAFRFNDDMAVFKTTDASYQQHRREAERPNAIWQADHTPLDVLLIRQEGQAAKPWLTTVIDDWSRAAAGPWEALILSRHAIRAVDRSHRNLARLDSQMDIFLRGGRPGEGKVRVGLRLESLLGNRNGVGTWRQIGYRIVAGIGGDSAGDRSCGRVLHGYFRSNHHCSLRIGNGAADNCVARLPKRRQPNQ